MTDPRGELLPEHPPFPPNIGTSSNTHTAGVFRGNACDNVTE